MSYISPRQRFVDDRIAEGCDREDILFLADLEFDEKGDERPGSIIAIYGPKA